MLNQLRNLEDHIASRAILLRNPVNLSSQEKWVVRYLYRPKVGIDLTIRDNLRLCGSWMAEVGIICLNKTD